MSSKLHKVHSVLSPEKKRLQSNNECTRNATFESQAESAYYVANMSVEVHKLIKLG